MKRELGYACMNLTLGTKVSRRIGRKKLNGLGSRGPTRISELFRENLKETLKNIEWNQSNGIKFYRMSSDILPWLSEYRADQLPLQSELIPVLNEFGKWVERGHRLGFHPSAFNVLGSLNPRVVETTIRELDNHAIIMDMMGIPQTHFFKINIHVNTAQEGKEESAKRFIKNWTRLSEGAKKRIVLENDDKGNLWRVEDLYRLIYQEIGVPITFDFHHWDCNPGELSLEEALRLSLKTWTEKPATHFSSSKQIEDPLAKKLTHADWLYSKVPMWDSDLEFDVMIEAKMKDLALLKWRSEYVG